MEDNLDEMKGEYEFFKTKEKKIVSNFKVKC